MTGREITTIGDPVLRERARELTREELGSSTGLTSTVSGNGGLYG